MFRGLNKVKSHEDTENRGPMAIGTGPSTEGYFRYSKTLKGAFILWVTAMFYLMIHLTSSTPSAPIKVDVKTFLKTNIKENLKSFQYDGDSGHWIQGDYSSKDTTDLKKLNFVTWNVWFVLNRY